MGWGRFFLLGNIGQQLDIQDQRAEIDDLRDELQRSRARPAGSPAEIVALQAENDELRLYLAAVVRLLISKGLVSREEMKQVVDAVDAEDGVRDGKYGGKVE
jgi:cell division septum initiation protein DivIVA